MRRSTQILEGLDILGGYEGLQREETTKGLMPNAADVIIEEIEGEDEDESFDQPENRISLEDRKKMRTTSFKEIQGGK